MARFYKLKISEIKRETPDCVSVVFDVPQDLKKDFNYFQGQYVTLKLNVNGEELRRSYSLCTSPVADDEFRVAVKKVKGGRASTFINDVLKVGEEMEVMSPMGNFYSVINPEQEKQYVLFAGGSGITPMLSIIKTVLKSEPKSRIALFYGNRDEQSIIFKKQIDELANTNSERFKVISVLENALPGSEEMHIGMLTKEKIKILLEKFVDLKNENEFFICGPGPMMENAKTVLNDLKVDPKKIHIEYFTAVQEAVKAAEEKSEQKAANIVKAKVTVILDDEETVFDLSTVGKSILDVAQEAGLDVPFACKGGVCCTCRAKVMEGKIIMDQNFALSQEEVELGYVLTCQSHPATEKVVISYDEP